MLFTRDACHRYGGRQPVCKHFGHWPWIFVGHDAGDRPCESRVIRCKRRPSLKKGSFSLVLVRARSLGGDFEYRIHAQGADRGLPSEKSRFPQTVVLGDLSPQKSATNGTCHRVRSVVGDVETAFQLAGPVWNLLRNPMITDDQGSHAGSRRKNPSQIFYVQVRGRSPELLLIFYQ